MNERIRMKELIIDRYKRDIELLDRHRKSLEEDLCYKQQEINEVNKKQEEYISLKNNLLRQISKEKTKFVTNVAGKGVTRKKKVITTLKKKKKTGVKK